VLLPQQQPHHVARLVLVLRLQFQRWLLLLVVLWTALAGGM
jgi:hypothetical protein